MEDCVEGALGLPPPLHWDIPFLQVSCLSTDGFHGFHDLSLRYGLIGDIDPATNEQKVTEKQKSFEKVKELCITVRNEGIETTRLFFGSRTVVKCR